MLDVDNPFAQLEQKRRKHPISMVNLFLFWVMTGLVVLGVVHLREDHFKRSQLNGSKVNLRSATIAVESCITPLDQLRDTELFGQAPRQMKSSSRP